MDSTEIHNVLTAKAKLDAEIRRLTDAFDDEHAGKLDRIIELFEQQANEEFHVRSVHHEVFARNDGDEGIKIHIHNGGQWGDDDCAFDLKVENGVLIWVEDYDSVIYQSEETDND